MKTDIVKYIFRYLPPFVETEVMCCDQAKWLGKGSRFKKKKILFEFCLYVNHAHYDMRIGYFPLNDIVIKPKGKDASCTGFLIMIENIEDEKDLLRNLKEVREYLKQENLLDGDYGTPEGYTYAKYKQ